MKTALGDSNPTLLRRASRAPAAALILAGSLIAGSAARVWLALHDDGIFWADEVFQSLEPAHRLVFGYGKVAWEFEQGARNWAYPAMIAAVFQLGSRLGSAPSAYLTLLRLLLCVVAAATAGGVYFLARRSHASALSAAVASALFMLAEPMIYFGHRAMSETACALPIVWGLAWLLPREPERRRPLLGAALLALACLIRLQTSVFCAVVLGLYALRRDKRELLQVLAIFALGAAVYGLIDRVTWGGWFHSAIVYFRFNVLEGKAAHWGVSPFYFYAQVLFSSMFGISVLLSALVLPGSIRAPALAVSAFSFLLLHSAIGHKEYRFILPAVPLLCALAALGLDAVAATRQRHQFATLLALLVALASVGRFPSLRLHQLGMKGAAPDESAYDRFGPVNRLMQVAHAQKDLCGLNVPGVPWWNLGGYAYLHRRVPLYGQNEAKPRAYNYEISSESRPRGEVIASDSGHRLVRTGSSCVPDPSRRY
ncbi:MAG TPA: hypothetical protein VFZ61_34700 [Polyangiales bacterium]